MRGRRAEWPRESERAEGRVAVAEWQRLEGGERE